MFDTVLGLPVHALVIHVVVVLVPLSAVGVAAIALVPRWRARFGWVVVALATAGLVAVPVATQSGYRLKERLNAGGVVARQIHAHQQLGRLVIYPVLAMWILALALMLLDRRARQGRVVAVVAALAVLGAGASTALVVLAGHKGSTAVWSCTIGSSACR
jgi:predicted membrane protein DUF2231